MLKSLITSLILFTSHHAPLKADPQQLTIAMGPDWCPFNCNYEINHSIDYKGVIPDILDLILSNLQYKTKISTGQSWTRVLADTEKGTYDMLAVLFKGDAPQLVFPAQPFAHAKNCFFVKKDNSWKYQSIESLKNVTVGIIKDFSYDDGGAFDEYVKNNPKSSKIFVLSSSDDSTNQGAQMLKSNRIEVYIDEGSVFKRYLQQKKLQAEFKEVGCLERVGVYIAFSPSSKKSAELARIFSEEYSKLEKAGKTLPILKKYGLN